LTYSNCNFAEAEFCEKKTLPERSLQGIFRTVLNVSNFKVSKNILNFEDLLCLFSPSEIFSASAVVIAPPLPNNKPIPKAKENYSS
jgi:hypothetical protein